MGIKIVKGAERGHVEWTVRKLVEMYDEGNLNFNIDIQRGYVWKDKARKSGLIRSLILDRNIPPLYFNKVDGIWEGEDGKQRTLTIVKFLHDEFELSDLDEFLIVNENGEEEEFNANGLVFSELPEEFQNAIKEYTFVVWYTDNADQDEVADTFFNLNNGQSLNAATMNRVKAKSKDQIIRLGKHPLFTEALSSVALDGHVNDDLVAKTHAILHTEDVCLDTAWVRKYMRVAEITEEDEKEMWEIFSRILKVHALIEDKKIAKRIFARTHMVSIVPIIEKSIKEGKTDEEMMRWFVGFFSGKKSATISSAYNSASGRGTGKSSAVATRLKELNKSYEKFFTPALAS